MTLPTPKYNIGDKVWLAYIESTMARHPCPDCLGTHKWAVKTPAGVDLTCECPRCSSYPPRTVAGKEVSPLTYRKWEGHVRELTIGSVRIDTNDDNPVQYMCVQTGVGSGNIWYESKLFEFQCEAEDEAKRLEDAENVVIRATPEAMRALGDSHLNITSALRQADWQSVYDAWAYARWYREAIDEVVGSEKEPSDYDTVADIRDHLEQKIIDAQRYEFVHPHPLEALLTAARTSVDPMVVKAVADIDAKFPPVGEP